MAIMDGCPAPIVHLVHNINDIRITFSFFIQNEMTGYIDVPLILTSSYRLTHSMLSFSSHYRNFVLPDSSSSYLMQKACQFA